MRTTKPAFLALDGGTSAGRAALFDCEGRLLAEAIRPWSYETPEDSAPWGREFVPDRFWEILCEAVRAVCAAGKTVGPYQVAAIAATAQRQAMVLLDAVGHELYAGPNIDLRGAFEGLRLLNERGPRIHAITGHLPPMMFAAARWLWFCDRRPDVCAQTAHLLMMPDWLTWRLCGELVTEASVAAESGLFDVARRVWSEEEADAAGIPLDILPPIRSAGVPAGGLRPAAAEALGLEREIPVVVAGTDVGCGLVAMDVTRPGQAGLVAGWSAPSQLVTDSPVLDPACSLWTTCSVAGAPWILEGNAGPTGSAHRWARDMLLPGGTFEDFDALAEQAAPGSAATLALLGPRIADYADPQLLWGGFLFPQANDILTCGRAEFARAVLENIAFAVRANLSRAESFAESAGQPRPRALRLGGGLAASPLFAQILADVLGMPVEVAPIPSVSAQGAAVCAATGAGFYVDILEAAERMRQPGGEWLPRPVARAEYLDAYERWLQAYETLSGLSQALG
jgi:sugar (pentulose or hexulose) kinase